MRDKTYKWRFLIMVVQIVAAVALVFGTVGFVEAQCAFDAPAKAKSLKSSLVREQIHCPPSVSFPVPNTTTMAGVAACAPPTPRSLYQFDDEKGSCSVLVKHSVQTPCPDEIAASCSVVRINTKCVGVLQLDGFTPTSTDGWTLNVINRATFNDGTNGDVTVIDMPLILDLPPFENGRLSSKFVFGGPCDGLFCDPFGPSIALPPCAQIEILKIALRDPNGGVFATLGSSGR